MIAILEASINQRGRGVGSFRRGSWYLGPYWEPLIFGETSIHFEVYLTIWL